MARSYVGRGRGTARAARTPRQGFDCSGFTKWVYARAHVARLPHNTDAQLAMRRMHRVRPARARAGDLVFYLSGGHSYHVAVYAGHHRQYAAATPRDGIRYQPVWSRRVVYAHWR